MTRGRPKGSKNKVSSNNVKPETAEELGEQGENDDGEETKGGLVIGNGEYRLTTNKLNVILQARNKNGNYVNWKYFSNPHNALETILNNEILETGLDDLKTICAKIDEVHKSIQAIPDNALPQMGSK
jgi:hypothetical protein